MRSADEIQATTGYRGRGENVRRLLAPRKVVIQPSEDLGDYSRYNAFVTVRRVV
jgi:hypothetical protein